MSNIVERKISNHIVKIERLNCIGSKNCINSAPDLFELDDEQICAFKADTETISQDVIVEACSVCPVSALFVFDSHGKQIIPG